MSLPYPKIASRPCHGVAGRALFAAAGRHGRVRLVITAVAGGPPWFPWPADVALNSAVGRADSAVGELRARGHGARGSAAGYRHQRSAALLGAGSAVIDRAVAALSAWMAHARASGPCHLLSPRERATAVLLRRLAPGYITVCARVVYVISEPDRWGFAWGTLPHKFDRGESGCGSEAVNVARRSGQHQSREGRPS